MLLGRLWQQIHIGFSLFNFRALMQINTRYKRVLYMVTLPDPFTSWPASLPAAYRQRRALLAVGRIVDKLSPGEPGLRLRRLWSLFVSLYALAAVVYAEAVGCEPNLPKTSTLFCVESFYCIKRTHLTVYKYTMGVHILPSTLSVEFLFHTFCESVHVILYYARITGYCDIVLNSRRSVAIDKSSFYSVRISCIETNAAHTVINRINPASICITTG